jgi:hypothetical protein
MVREENPLIGTRMEGWNCLFPICQSIASDFHVDRLAPTHPSVSPKPRNSRLYSFVWWGHRLRRRPSRQITQEFSNSSGLTD